METEFNFNYSHLFISIFLVSGLFFTSCKKDENPLIKPDIQMSIESSEIYIEVNDVVVIEAEAIADNKYREEWELDGKIVVSGIGRIQFKPVKPGIHVLNYRAHNTAGEFTKSYIINVNVKESYPDIKMSIETPEITISVNDVLIIKAESVLDNRYNEEWEVDNIIVSDSSDNIEFKPTEIGTYVINYRAYNSIGEFTKSYIVNVKAKGEQTHPVKFTFKGVVGNKLLIKLAAKTVGNVEVDFGDGAIKTLGVTTTATSAGAANITGVILDTGIITIYSTVKIHWINFINQNLLEADFTENPDLEQADMSGNNIVSFDLSKNPKLNFLSVNRNATIASLDFSHNLLLRTVSGVDASSLEEVSLGGLTNLNSINLTNSKISNLDLINKPKLESLFVGNARLTSLDLSQCPLLKILDINNNNLSNLDLSKNINLGLTGNVNLKNNSFSAQALNTIYDALPKLTVISRSLFVSGNPGAITSATSIATLKNWTTDVTGDASSLD